MNNRGLALPTTLLFMLILAVIAAIAVKSTIASLGTAAHHKSELVSYYRAEAGVTYPIAMLEDKLKAETIHLGGATVVTTYPQPPTFQMLSDETPPFSTFSQVELQKIPGTDRYRFTTTGWAGSSKTTLEVEVERETFVKYAVFGDLSVTIDNNATVSSYDSAFSKALPTAFPKASTKEAQIGSNTMIDINSGAEITGDLFVGPKPPPLPPSGKIEKIEIKSKEFKGKSTLFPTEVNSDPLAIDELFTVYSKLENTNNDLIGNITEITNSTVTSWPLILPSGIYYLTNIDLPKDAVIKVTGPVKIFLNGPFDTKNGECLINYETNSAKAVTSLPANLQIYSNSDKDIIIDNKARFVGVIYAPKAKVKTDNQSVFLGMMWASEAKVDNKANFMFDTALRSAIGYNKLITKSWKQLP